MPTRGVECIGFDVDADRVARINDGENYIQDVDDNRLQSVVEEGQLRATADEEQAEVCDVFFVYVPTPVDEHNEPDTSYI